MARESTHETEKRQRDTQSAVTAAGLLRKRGHGRGWRREWARELARRALRLSVVAAPIRDIFDRVHESKKDTRTSLMHLIIVHRRGILQCFLHVHAFDGDRVSSIIDIDQRHTVDFRFYSGFFATSAKRVNRLPDDILNNSDCKPYLRHVNRKTKNI